MNQITAHKNLQDKSHLDALHETLIERIRLSAEDTFASDLGQISERAGTLSADCLGLECTVQRQLISVNGRFYANEYVFRSVPSLGSRIVWRMYLPHHKALYSSLSGGGLICLLSSEDIRTRITTALAADLPNAQLFCRRTDASGAPTAGH